MKKKMKKIFHDFDELLHYTHLRHIYAMKIACVKLHSGWDYLGYYANDLGYLYNTKRGLKTNKMPNYEVFLEVPNLNVIEVEQEFYFNMQARFDDLFHKSYPIFLENISSFFKSYAWERRNSYGQSVLAFIVKCIEKYFLMRPSLDGLEIMASSKYFSSGQRAYYTMAWEHCVDNPTLNTSSFITVSYGNFFEEMVFKNCFNEDFNIFLSNLTNQAEVILKDHEVRLFTALRRHRKVLKAFYCFTVYDSGNASSLELDFPLHAERYLNSDEAHSS